VKRDLFAVAEAIGKEEDEAVSKQNAYRAPHRHLPYVKKQKNNIKKTI
jgi:hypothetical protein